MAGVNIRGRSYVERDGGEYIPDDVLSLDSWSDPFDQPAEYMATVNHNDSYRFRSGSTGSSSGLVRVPTGRRGSNVRIERTTKLKSQDPAYVASGSGTDRIPSVSASLDNSYLGDLASMAVHSETVPFRPPSYDRKGRTDGQRREVQPHSPSRRTPDHGGHLLFFASNIKRPPVHHPTRGHWSVFGIRPQNVHHSDHYGHSRGNPAIEQQGVMGGIQRTHHQHGQHYHSPHSHGVRHQIHRHVPGSRAGTTYQNGSHTHVDPLFPIEGEKLKTKVKSMWNNVKYGWTIKTKTNFKYDSPIFLLGRCYHHRAEETGQQEEEGQNIQQLQQEHHSPQHQHQHRVSALDEFNSDFTSRLWFTYRREFAPIGSSRMTTDCGWGCMLRSGQMMMAQALVQHFLGRDWRVYSEQKAADLEFYREIIRWFGDYPSDKMPFSLHHLVELGTSVGKMPGDWYGPASVAHILRDALVTGSRSLPKLRNIAVYVAQDCTIYVQDLINLVSQHPRKDSEESNGSTEEETTATQPQPQQTESSQTDWWAVIVLIPMRLGGETLNQIYIPCVKSMLAHDNCIGIIGGKPKHSLYFIGWQDEKLIYLDPHYCQDVVDTTKLDFPIQSFHCMSPRKILFTKMDPSCTVGFYCRNKEELQNFIRQIPDMVVPPRQKGQYPLFVVAEGTSSEMQAREPPYRELGRLHIRHVRCDQDGNRIRGRTVDSDDFIIL